MNIRQVVKDQQDMWSKRARGEWDNRRCEFCHYAAEQRRKSNCSLCLCCPVYKLCTPGLCKDDGHKTVGAASAYWKCNTGVNSKQRIRLARIVLREANRVARYYHLKQVPIPEVK